MTLDTDILELLPKPVLVLRDGRVEWTSRRFRELVGHTAEGLADLAVGDLFEEPSARELAVRCKAGGGADVELQATLVASDGHTFPVDCVLALGPDDRILVVVRGVGSSVGAEELVAHFGSLYTAHGAAAMVDLESLFEASRPVFQSLGWHVMVWEVMSDGEHLVPRFYVPRSNVPTPAQGFGRALLGKAIASQDVFGAREVLAEKKSRFLEDLPGAAMHVARLLGRSEEATAQVGAALSAAELRRGAWAPSLVGERVRYLSMVAGDNIGARELAAAQLFAAQISATVQLGELSVQMVRQQRLAALGQMSALLAHEVRNPLAVMFQVHRQLRRRVGAAASIDDLMAMLEEEAGRLARLVDELVSFAGPSRPRLQPESPSQAVALAVSDFWDSLPDSAPRPALEVAVPPDLPMVVADPLMLRQALTQLLLNACDHLRPGGEVRVQVTDHDLTRVRIQVTNDFDPLPEDVAVRVFEPFFTTKATGIGLGLAVVRRLVEDQGGTVTHDDEGAGVSFSVWLPKAE